MEASTGAIRKILVIEDERELIDLLTLHLTAEGYKVDAAADGEAGLRAFQAGQYGMVLLDWMLPTMSGIDVLRGIRAIDTRTPVVMLTGRVEESDKVLGLELGCDDYLGKPFSIRELTARIKALYRRIERAEELGRDPAHRERYDWALARAVAEMPALAEYLLPLVRVGGAILAQKGEGAAAEVHGADAAILTLGGRVRQLVPVELRGLAETRYLVVVDKVAATLEKSPRRPGVPQKRPLG